MRQVKFVLQEQSNVAEQDMLEYMTKEDVMQVIYDILKSKPREQYLTHVVTTRWKEDSSLAPRVWPSPGEYSLPIGTSGVVVPPTRVTPLGTRYYDITLYTQ